MQLLARATAASVGITLLIHAGARQGEALGDLRMQEARRGRFVLRCVLVVGVGLALLMSAPASAEQLSTRQLSAGHERYPYPDVAVNGRGEGYAVWVQREETRVVGRGLFDRSAGDIETLSGPLYDEPYPAPHPLVAVNQAGLTLVLWRGNENLEARFRMPDGRMGEVLDVSDTDAIPVQVAVGPLGDAVFIWRTGTENGVYVRRYRPDKGLGPVTRITPEGEEISDARAAVSIGGRIVFVWQRYDSRTEDRIRARELRPDDSLGPVLDISPPVEPFDYGDQEPRVAINAAGDAFVVWTGLEAEENRALGRHWDSTGLLGPIQELEGGSYQGNVMTPLFVDVAMNDRGEAFAVWRFANIVDSHYWAIHGRRRSPSGSLDQVEEFARASRIGSPNVGLDDAGEAVVAWATVDPSGISARRRPPDGTHTDVVTVSRNDYWSPYPPVELATSCAGHAIFVWTNLWDDGNSVHESHFSDYSTRTSPCLLELPPPFSLPPPEPPTDDSSEAADEPPLSPAPPPARQDEAGGPAAAERSALPPEPTGSSQPESGTPLRMNAVFPEQKLAAFLSTGLNSAATCTKACELRVALTLDEATARSAGLYRSKPITLRWTSSAPTGVPARLVLRVPKALRPNLRRARSIRMLVRVTARAGTETYDLRRRITVRR